MGTATHADTARYAKCIEVSKRIRWDIDRDVIRGRSFDFTKKFLPDGLSLVDRLDCLDPEARAMRRRYIGGLLRGAWNAALDFIRFGASVLTRRMVGARHIHR